MKNKLKDQISDRKIEEEMNREIYERNREMKR